MSNIQGCMFCEYSNPNRKKERKIRCTRFSEWRDPLHNTCETYFDRALAQRLEEVRKLKEGAT